jgi:hypothetical protein
VFFALAAIAAAVLGSPPGRVSAQEVPPVPSGDFVLLLAGVYEPATHGPDLGLSDVELRDGSFVKTKIYRVSGLPGTSDQAVGTYYDNFLDRDAYQLPGGAISALYLEFVIDEIIPTPDGILEIGHAELVITEATGIYKPWVGGSIHMEFETLVFVDDLGNLIFDEHCFCFISRPS